MLRGKDEKTSRGEGKILETKQREGKEEIGAAWVS